MSDVTQWTDVVGEGEVAGTVSGAFAGVPMSDLASDLAGESAFTSVFQARSAYREWMSAGHFSISTGTPTLALGTGFQVYLLDAGSTERVSSSMEFPTWMTSVDIIARGFNAGAGSGDVVIELNHKVTADGAAVPGTGTAVPVTFTAGSTNLRQSVTLATGVSVPAGSSLRLQVARLGADGADTLGNDWGFLGLVLQPAA